MKKHATISRWTIYVREMGILFQIYITTNTG